MRFRSTYRLLVVVCLLGGVIWVTGRCFESTDEHRRLATQLLCFKAEDVGYLMIERGDLRIDCVKKNGAWFLDWPLRASANGGEIDRILNVLESMPREEVITASQLRDRELGVKDYGLGFPRARFALGDDLSRNEVLVGHGSPLGDLVYVKLASSEEIVAVTRNILDIIPGKIENLRDRTILHGDASRTTSMEITCPGGGFIQLTRAAGEWSIQQPVLMQADSGKIARMLDALYALKVEKFVWDPVVATTRDTVQPTRVDMDPGARVELYGLAPDEAAARITVWVDGDEVGKELILGKQAGENSGQVYAKLRDIDSIYLVGKNILDTFSVTVSDLRSRNLFSIKPADVRYACFQEGDRKVTLRRNAETGWVLVEPVQWRADDEVVCEIVRRVTRLSVESFVEGQQTNLTSLGLDPPAYTVQIMAESPAPSGEGEKAIEADTDTASRHRLLVGTPREGEETVFVKFEDSESLFAVLRESVSSLGPHPADPLVYRVRTMLAVPSMSIRRVSLLKDGAEQTIARDESGTWIPISPATDEVDHEVVHFILFSVSNLRALRIESHNPENLAVYGLDRSGTALTLGLTGEEGIQKSVMLGFRAKTDGIYAMVQGQDVVFVLKRELAERLTRDLVRTLQRPESGHE